MRTVEANLRVILKIENKILIAHILSQEVGAEISLNNFCLRKRRSQKKMRGMRVEGVAITNKRMKDIAQKKARDLSIEIRLLILKLRL